MRHILRRLTREVSWLVVVPIHDTRIDRGGPAVSPATPFRYLLPRRLVSNGFAYPLFNGGRGAVFLHVVGPFWDDLGGRVADALSRVSESHRANVRSSTPTSANLVVPWVFRVGLWSA